MSQNVIYEGRAFHLVEVDDLKLVLRPVFGQQDDQIRVDVSAPSLVIDPTDDQWFAVRYPDLPSGRVEPPR
jgi:hypothetical protein